jgi:hypothetical protein
MFLLCCTHQDQTFVKKLIGHTKSLRCMTEVQIGGQSASFLGRKSVLVVSSGDDMKLCLWNARSVLLSCIESPPPASPVV